MNMLYILMAVAWDVFLAVIPVVLAFAIYRTQTSSLSKNTRTVLSILLGLAWLAFLPNTCYLLTEWRHFLTTLDAGNLYMRSHADRNLTFFLMIYTAFYFCFSGIGMLAFALAIRPIAKLARKYGYNLVIFGIPLFLMVSVGVYLGLILRYNSWDLITHPGEVLQSMLLLTSHPFSFTLTILFAGFLWLAYIAIDIWISGFAARWRNRSTVTSIFNSSRLS